MFRFFFRYQNLRWCYYRSDWLCHCKSVRSHQSSYAIQPSKWISYTGFQRNFGQGWRGGTLARVRANSSARCDFNGYANSFLWPCETWVHQRWLYRRTGSAFWLLSFCRSRHSHDHVTVRFGQNKSHVIEWQTDIYLTSCARNHQGRRSFGVVQRIYGPVDAAWPTHDDMFFGVWAISTSHRYEISLVTFGFSFWPSQHLKHLSEFITMTVPERSRHCRQQQVVVVRIYCVLAWLYCSQFFCAS